MGALVLRIATPGDIAFIQSLEQRDDYAAFIYRWDRERHEASLAEPAMRYLIGEDAAGAPVGFAILRNIDGKAVPYLVRMAVAAPGKGVGRGFLKAVCDWVFETSAATAIELDVFEDNLRARALYSRLGFREDRLSEAPVDRPNGEQARLVYMSLTRSVT